jgi:hypothetical protein
MAMTSTHGRSLARNARSKQLKNGATEGELVRVYQDHQMRFAWAVEVDSGIGFGPNVLVQYLDDEQDQEKLYGNIIQPVHATWLQTLKTRMAGLESELSNQTSQESAKGKRVTPQKRLKCGVKEGVLVRIYREHHIRFGYATAIDSGLGLGPNVTVRYLDSEPGDVLGAKVYGNIVQPVNATWLENMKTRVQQLEQALEAKS